MEEVIDHSNDHFNGDRPACEEPDSSYSPPLCRLCKLKKGCLIISERKDERLCFLYRPKIEAREHPLFQKELYCVYFGTRKTCPIQCCFGRYRCIRELVCSIVFWWQRVEFPL